MLPPASGLGPELPGGSEKTPEFINGWDDLGLIRRPGVRGWFRRHTRSMTAVVVGVYIVFAFWFYPIAFLDMGDEAWWLVLGFGVISAALCFRNARPMTVLVMIALFEAAMLYHYPWQLAQMVGLCFAAYSVGYHYGLKWSLLTALPACAVGYSTLLVADTWLRQNDGGFWAEIYAAQGLGAFEALVVIAVMMFFVVGISAGIGAAVRRGHRHEREIVNWARRSHQLAQLGERNRIAREMHDVVAHSLSVMVSLADGARVVAKKNPERSAEVMGEVSATGRGALADMRRVIGVLRKGEAADTVRRPITESLDGLYESFRQAGLPLHVEQTGPALTDDAAFGLTVHRIIQESLTNVLRYGRGVNRVEVAIEHLLASEDEDCDLLSEQGFSEEDQQALGVRNEAQVIITITDDGVPPAPGTRRESIGSQLGIQGMQERAGFYSGSVYAGPGKHRGWMVRAVLEPPPTAKKGTG